MTTIKSLAYLVALAAICVWSMDVGRWLVASGMSINAVIFGWFVLVACFSWSVSRWLTDRRHW